MPDGSLCGRTARRLTRLFRLERHGRFDRLPLDLAQRLVQRRGLLIRQLQECAATTGERRELDRAFRDLAVEVNRAQTVAQRRHDDLMQQIRFRNHALSGLRGEAVGHLLGRG